MFEELWSEIQDMPGEIFDMENIEEQQDDDDKTFAAFLKSDWDFWYTIQQQTLPILLWTTPLLFFVNSKIW